MDARVERLRTYELQGPPISPVLEEALPAPQDYRVDHQPQLVQEPLLESDRTRAPLPMIVMSLPGCRFNSEIPSTNSSLLISTELFHSRGSSRVPETTYLRTLFM